MGSSGDCIRRVMRTMQEVWKLVRSYLKMEMFGIDWLALLMVKLVGVEWFELVWGVRDVYSRGL